MKTTSRCTVLGARELLAQLKRIEREGYDHVPMPTAVEIAPEPEEDRYVVTEPVLEAADLLAQLRTT